MAGNFASLAGLKISACSFTPSFIATLTPRSTTTPYFLSEVLHCLPNISLVSLFNSERLRCSVELDVLNRGRALFCNLDRQ